MEKQTQTLTNAEIHAVRVEKEANNWEIPTLDKLEKPTEGDLPIIDISPFRTEKSEAALENIAAELSKAFKNTGFFILSNHGCESIIENTIQATQLFHDTLSQQDKESISFSNRGVGYLKINQKILPKREKGNMNETFIVKRELGPRNITLESNSFPPEEKLPGFKKQVLDYANSMERLSMSLLPCFAVALGLPPGYFDEAFTRPLFRLRLSHYPVVQKLEPSQYGIAPHTDTSFFTLLAQVSYEMPQNTDTKKLNATLIVPHLCCKYFIMHFFTDYCRMAMKDWWCSH